MSIAMVGHRNKTRRVRGSALVEMALVAALLFVIILGIMDLAQFLFCEQALVERARAAARWGAVTEPTNTTAITNVVLYSQATVPAGATPSLGLTSAMVSVSTPDANTDNYRLVVTLSGYSFQLLSPFISGRYGGAPITVAVPLDQYN
jgi:Flp pilus assembly protein TadG